MRAPRIRVKTQRTGLHLKLKQKSLNTSCAICKSETCIDEQRVCDRLTRSVFKKCREELIYNTNIIIYETYRCMPLLGDEKVHAPDWEEHIVRYHIVFAKKNEVA